MKATLACTVVGVPLIVAVVGLKDKPAGSVPLLTDHVKGPRPPVTVSVRVYGVPTFPPGSVLEVMDGAGAVKRLEIPLVNASKLTGEGVDLNPKRSVPFG